MNPDHFKLTEPDGGRSSSVIFASPHSGRDYSPAFIAQSNLDMLALRSSEDAFVDKLFMAAESFGSPLLCALAPRAYVDLNRAADELDSAVIDGLTLRSTNARVASGLGVIPRVVSHGRAIYQGKMTVDDAMRRLDAVWHPYHTTLARLMHSNVERFGESILIDCHSMPHDAIQSFARPGVKRPNVVLGDRYGSSASATLLALVEAAFTRQGFQVSRNAPFSGAYIVQQYGRPSRNQHAIQVEIDRAMYMNEQTIQPSANFLNVQIRLTAAIEEIAAIGRMGMARLAAE
ncbi:MAG: N-formylglutamate amidohydrolase [Deltaproteobacteria bacterium]